MKLYPPPAGRHPWLAEVARRVLALFGWHVRFDGLPGPKGVAIVYPHTSNWDFVIGLLAKWSTNSMPPSAVRAGSAAPARTEHEAVSAAGG